jgi:hypothetical protein
MFGSHAVDPPVTESTRVGREPAPGLTFSSEGVVSINRSGEGKEAVEFVARWALVDALFKHQPVALAKKKPSWSRKPIERGVLSEPEA